MSYSFRHLVLAGMLLTPTIVPMPAFAQKAPDRTAIEVNGQIKDTDPNDPVRQKPARVFQVKLSKGQTYQIDLTSGDFDAYLRLVNSAGQEVAHDDDGGEGLNARIRYTPTADGTFKIYATTFAGGTGAFSLKVQGAGAELIDAKGVADPAPAAAVAEVVLDLKGNIQATDNADPVQQNPCKIHEVKLKKGVPYVIDMKSTDFDSFLRLEDDAGKELAQDDDGGGDLNARIRYTPTKDGSFKIYATSFDGGNGAYSLAVKSVVPGAVGKAAPLPAPAAGKPAEVTSKLTQDDPKDVARNRPARTHTVELKAGKTYVIDLMSTDFDCFLRLEDPNGQRIDEDDDGGGNLNSRITFQCPADGRYRLVATTFNGRVGEYVLRVTEQ